MATIAYTTQVPCCPWSSGPPARALVCGANPRGGDTGRSSVPDNDAQCRQRGRAPTSAIAVVFFGTLLLRLTSPAVQECEQADSKLWRVM